MSLPAVDCSFAADNLLRIISVEGHSLPHLDIKVGKGMALAESVLSRKKQPGALAEYRYTDSL
jgi:hypothetical protein